MIRITKKGKRPDILFTSGANINKDKLVVETEKNKELYNKNKGEYDSGKKKFSFKSSLYGHDEIKDALIEIQHKKCCFCEAKVLHVSDGDVEHFRPKKAYRQKKKAPLRRPGYYWLAYDWNNLFLACIKCNQRNKENMFPLNDGRTRARNHKSNLKKEKALFLHPEFDNPESHIEFKEAFIKPKRKSDKGLTTITELNLTRLNLYEQRKTRYDIIYALIGAYQRIPNDIPADEISKNQIRKILRRSISEEEEYTSMIKSNFGKIINEILSE